MQKLSIKKELLDCNGNIDNNVKIIKQKVGLLTSAEELGSVSKACRVGTIMRYFYTSSQGVKVVFPVALSRMFCRRSTCRLFGFRARIYLRRGSQKSWY